MATTNLRDSNIFMDFTVWINNVGKIGAAPGFQPPEIKMQTEEFRGGGMDGTVEIPLGVEKLEFDFEMHTWDPDIFNNLGYGPNALDCPISFRGYLLTPAGVEKGVLIRTSSLIKEIKPSKIQAGKKAELTISCVANVYEHKIDNKIVNAISVFDKILIINGVDKNVRARQILGFNA